MKLKNYYKEYVGIADKKGAEHIGIVTDYISAINNTSGKEHISLQVPSIEFNQDDISSIELLQEDNSLISVDDICELLDIKLEIAEVELESIEAEVYRAYKCADVSRIAINMNRMDFFDWICDACDCYLNFQSNFPKDGGNCRCEICGHLNEIKKEDLINRI